MPTKRPPKKDSPEATELARIMIEHPGLVCPVVSCAWNHQPLDRRRTKVWQFMHQMAHGHGTFSAGTLADLAVCSLPEAESALKSALDWQIVMVAQKSQGKTIYSGYARPPKAPALRKLTVTERFGKASASLWG